MNKKAYDIVVCDCLDEFDGELMAVEGIRDDVERAVLTAKGFILDKHETAELRPGNYSFERRA